MSVSKRIKKQSRVRRKFTPEFKAEVVRLCRTSGESVGEVCKRLDLTETAVRRWVEQSDVDGAGGTADALTTAEREELQRLRRENKRLQMEREILKKAAVGSNGRRNGWYQRISRRCIHGATRSPRFVGAAEDGALVQMEAGPVAQRYWPSAGKASWLDPRSTGCQRRHHTVRQEA